MDSLKFMLERKELTLTLDDFRTIFHLPQVTNNNHDCFVPALKFFEIVPFYVNNLGFTLELRSTSNFKTTSLLQPWQTLCEMFSRCLTTRVSGYDQPSLQIMQMLYCFVNNIHVDYAKLLWEGFHYSRQLVPLGHLPLLLLKENQVLHKRLLSLDFVFLHDTRLTPPTPISTTDETDDLQDTLQNVEANSSPLMNDDNQIVPSIRLEPKSDKESPEVEKIADISQPLNVIEEEEELAEVDYEFRRQAKRKHVEEIRNTPSPTTIRSPLI
nr:hypothetical protein [Tanacetum cinerariifolium]